MSFALLFAGQGTQHAAMLPWLEAEPVCQPALELLQSALASPASDIPQQRSGPPWRTTLHDAQLRSSNRFAQPLITATSLAAWAALQQQLQSTGAVPRVVAGYSVGELAAFAAAGLCDASAAVLLAVQRAQHMDAAVQGVDTGLLSVSGLPVHAVLAQDARLDCAIHLAADHGIYAAESAVLERCAVQLALQGGIAKVLEVRVASHSRWMVPAAASFATVVQQQTWAQPVCAVALNATGALTRHVPTLLQGLSQQLCSTVQWAACMDAIAETGVRCVMEIGAGSALAALWNARHPAIPARALEDFRDAGGAARWMAKHLEA